MSFWFQASLGGNLRFVLTASAPISSTVLSFLRATLGCLIFEGYGQTECTSGCTFSMPGDSSTGDSPFIDIFALVEDVPPLPQQGCGLALSGHVGAPLPCAMVKLVDIPDMNYYAKNGEGEVSWCQCILHLPSRSWPNCVMLHQICILRSVFRAQVCSEAT